METIKQRVFIPSNHKLHFDLDVPESIDTGEAEVLVVFQPKDKDKDKKPKRRVGMFKGKVFMSKDFDDEMPDSFWLGEDT